MDSSRPLSGLYRRASISKFADLERSSPLVGHLGPVAIHAREPKSKFRGGVLPSSNHPKNCGRASKLTAAPQELKKMPCGKKRKRHKINTHKRKKRLRKNRHKKKDL